MNRTIPILLTALCAFAITCAAEPTLGGYTKASVTDKEVIAAAAFAIKAQSIAMQEGPGDRQPVKLELVKILRAEQQVVAGTNYRLALRMKQGGNKRVAEAVVWWQPWRPKPYQLTSWEWQ